jgi:hypothetical protein
MTLYGFRHDDMIEIVWVGLVIDLNNAEWILMINMLRIKRVEEQQ